ncbi:MAG: hypothetical protein QXK80_01450 [Candidatus Pacearchaeota archaeon]
MSRKLFTIFTFLLAIYILEFVSAQVNWQEIEQRPSKLYDIKLLEAAFNEDAIKTVKIIDQNPELLQREKFKEHVINKIDVLARQNIAILNNNPNVKREWFLHYGIKDKGGTLQTYDGEIVTLAFLPVSFNIREQSGSIVNYDDTLILPNKAVIRRGLVRLEEAEKKVVIFNGTIDITNAEEIELSAITSDYNYCSIIDGKKKIFVENKETSSSRTNIIKTKSFLSIEGENIVLLEKIIIDEKEEYRPYAEISGKVTFEDDVILLERGASYKDYWYGLKNAHYKVSKKTFILNEPDACNEKKVEESCIETDPNKGTIKVKAKDNHISIETFSLSPFSTLYVEPIIDGSEIIFIDKGIAKIVFSKKPFTIEGYLHRLSTDIFYQYLLNGELHEIQIKDGLLKYCSLCETKGSIYTIDLTKFQTQEIKLFENSYKWATFALRDERYSSLGGAKGKIVYADKYKTYEKQVTQDLESYKKLILRFKEGNLTEKKELKKLVEERIKKLEEQLAQETDESKKQELMKEISERKGYIRDLEREINFLEEQIERIKKIEYAYDCIGFVQAAFIEGEKAMKRQPYNWYKETDGFKLVQELTSRYNLNKVLVVFGSPFNETHYIHGVTKDIAPIPPEILATRTKILYFETKRERDDFLRTIPPGSPFQNYNIDGTPHHSGIKGISDSSLEAHIGQDIGYLSEDDIQRYNDPLVFAFPEKKRLTLDDLQTAKK